MLNVTHIHFFLSEEVA